LCSREEEVGLADPVQSAQEDLISDAQALLSDLDAVFPAAGGAAVEEADGSESAGADEGEDIDSDELLAEMSVDDEEESDKDDEGDKDDLDQF
jgi:hypothetical protein